MNLYEGQLLQVTREHFTFSQNGIITLYVDDLILVVETPNFVQARVIRLNDGVETCIIIQFTIQDTYFTNQDAYTEMSL